MDNLIKKFLFDIYEATKSIDAYLEGNRDFNHYLSNKMLRRAFEREFEIIGEAMQRIHKINPEINISSKAHIIGMRNRVIHGYDRIDNEIIWGTIIKYLPKLHDEIKEMLDQDTPKDLPNN